MSSYPHGVHERLKLRRVLRRARSSCHAGDEKRHAEVIVLVSATHRRLHAERRALRAGVSTSQVNKSGPGDRWHEDTNSLRSRTCPMFGPAQHSSHRNA